MDSEVIQTAVSGQQNYDGHKFPLVHEWQSISSTDRSLRWVEESRGELSHQLDLHGAILFRNFAVETDQDFDEFVRAFDYPNFPYKDSLSNAVRVNRTEHVFTANEAPPEVSIFLHHEMAQTPIYPSKLFFFCEKPADEGGSTPLCRSDVLWTRIENEHPYFALDCREKGLLYTNVMPAENDPSSGMGRSWQSTFKAETHEQAKVRMTQLGYTWQWLDNGCLRATTPNLPAVREVSDGRHTFFNQIIAAFKGWKDTRNDPSKALTFGDGSPLNPTTVEQVADIADELTFDVPWQQGDVALVDNFLVMHGRRTFKGTRKVLASLVG